MPYAIRRKGARYQVVNTETGKVYSTTTKAKAERQIQILRGVERDWTPTGDGTYSREVNGQRVHMKVT